MAIACIALGSNLGDRQGWLDRAVEMLSSHPAVRLLARSRSHRTEPVGGPPGQPEYLNAALRIETDLDPRPLLELLGQIELALGRPPVSQRVSLAARTIDLDLLLYDEKVIEEPGLTVPHPRMHLRRFVLEPLAEIAPDMRHPLLGATVAEMLSWLDRPAGRQ